MRAPDDGREYKKLLDEDFALMTAGEENNPVKTYIEDSHNNIPSKYTNMPGWMGRGIMQAGGHVAIGFVTDSYTHKEMTGQIETPPLSLYRNNGTAYLTLRARSLSGEIDLIHVFWQNAEFTKGEDQSIYISGDWRTLQFTLTDCTEDCSIVIYSEYGEVVLDDIVIEQFQPEIEAPTALKWTDFTGDSFTCNWSKVENADHYILNVFTIYGKNNEDTGEQEYWSYKVKNLELTETSYNVTGLKPERIYYYYVKAVNAAGVESEDSRIVEVVDLLTPEGITTENITADGFHSRWEPVINAESYVMQTVVDHTAINGDEVYPLLDEKFDMIDFSATGSDIPDIDNPAMDNIGLTDLDNAMTRSGWTLYEGGFIQGGICMRNRTVGDELYYGELLSPAYGITQTDGTITVTADYLSHEGRRPYIQLAQAKGVTSSGSIVYDLADAKTLKAATGEWTTQSATLKTIDDMPKVIRLSIMVDGDETDKMLFVDNVKITVNLPDGSTQRVPYFFNELTDLSELLIYCPTPDRVKGDTFSYQLLSKREHPTSSWLFKRYVTSPWSESIPVPYEWPDDGISNIAGDNSSISAHACDGGIAIVNPDGVKVTIVSLSGSIIAETSATSATIPVMPGAYIVASQSGTVKVVL